MVKSTVKSSSEIVLDLTEKGPIRVLHVDDEAGFLKAAKQCLEMQSAFQVDTASSVEEAMEKMKKKEFDVVVADYVMPGKNGLQFLKELREEGNNIPFIIFTGKGREEVAIKALNWGADRYFNKFGDPETVYGELVHGIRKVVEARRALEVENLYGILVENLQDAIVFSDLNGRGIFVNKAAEELTGYKREEILGRSVREIIPRKYWPLCDEINKKAAMGKRVPYVEMEIRRKDGEIVPVETGGQVIKENGKITGSLIIARDITERKKAEQLLRESEEKYRNLLENARDTIMAVYLDGNIAFVNRVVEEYGFKKEEIVGKSMAEFVSEKYWPRIVKDFAKVIQGNPVEGEIELITPKGKIVSEYRSNPIRKGDKVIGSHTTLRDITERKKAEEELKESESRYRKLVEQSLMGVIISQGYPPRIVFANQSAADLLGYTTDELVSLSPKETMALISPEDRKMVLQRYHKRLRGEQPLHRYAFLMTRKDKTKRWVETHSTTITYEGKPAVQAVLLDITERKKAEEALRESEEKYRSIVELAPDMIVTSDLKGVITSFNTAGTRISGYSKDEVVGKHFLTIGPKKWKDWRKYLKMFKSLLRRKVSEPFEVILRHKDGTLRTVEVRVSLMKQENKPTGILAILRDNTERKKVDESLKRTLAKLGTMNEKLSVVGNLTRHDARNKLSTVTMNSFLAKQKLPSNHKALKHLSEIESAVTQVERIFDFARIYEKLGMEELTYMDVEESLNEAVKLFSDLQGAKMINDCHGLTVLADSLIRQFLYNLVDNSLKHGKKVTQIKVHYETKKDHLKLIYEDNGIGMPKTEKKKIFNKGYGLQLIKKISEVYDWTIRETGKPNKGAQFTITIPKTNKNGKTNYQLQ